ncbi:MAG: DUF6932 family protein [bacterium]
MNTHDDSGKNPEAPNGGAPINERNFFQRFLQTIRKLSWNIYNKLFEKIMSFPDFNAEGDLPVGIYRASLQEVIRHFGTSTAKRMQVARRLERIYSIASATGKIAHFITFGSFVTDKPEPNDVDIFIIMEDDFDARMLSGEAQILFDHLRCQAYFGASVFWVRRMAAWGSEQSAIEDWQIKRDGNKRGSWR